MAHIQEKTHSAFALSTTLGRCRRAFVSVGLFSAIINILMLVPAIYMLQVYDRVLSSQNKTTLLMLSLILLGLFLLMAALEYIRGMVLVRCGNQMDMSLNQKIYNASFRANLMGKPVDAAQTLGDLTQLRQFLTGQGLFAFFDAPWFPIYLAVIFLFDPWLGLLALGGAVVLLLLAFFNEKSTAVYLADASRLSQQAGQVSTGSLRQSEVIEAMGMLPALRQRWLDLQIAFLCKQSQASDNAVAFNAATKTARVALQSFMLGFAALLVIDGSISAGMMIAASILMGRTLAPIEQIIGCWKQWQQARLAYTRLQSLLLAYPEKPVSLPLPAPVGQVTIENLSACAPGTRNLLLKNIHCTINAGSLVALVGPSGSGKSTLARLLTGIWPATSGCVRLDGADIYQWNKDELGKSVGYLPQEVALFAGTVADNIARFAVSTSTAERDADKIVAAAKLAGVHELILQLPQGYDTPLGEQGAGLSGGQKQRIGLARALYNEPALVVLDEPNANLDDAGDRALMAALAQLKARGCTVIFISHRQNLVQQATHILALHNGQLRAFNSMEEIAAQGKKQAPVSTLSYAQPGAVRVQLNNLGEVI